MGLGEFFNDFCKEKEINFKQEDFNKMLGCFEKEWDGNYNKDQIVKNLVNYGFEDFLLKKYKRKNPKEYPKDKTNENNERKYNEQEMKFIGRKVDDLLFINNKNSFKLFKEVDRNNDGHVCQTDLENHLHKRLNIDKEEAKAFTNSIYNNQKVLSYRDFHQKLFPGFSQKKNYQPGTKFTNVLGLKGNEPESRLNKLSDTNAFMETVKEQFKIKKPEDNCGINRFLLCQ